MHAHAFSVSFPCVDLKYKGSREPQKIKLKRTKVHALFVYIHPNDTRYKTNPYINTLKTKLL